MAGEMVFYRTLSKNLLEEFLGVEIPLVDHKVKFQNGKIREIAERVIEREGVEVEQFRLNKIKKSFFKSVSRKLIAIPEGLEISDPFPDEINLNKFKLIVSFVLPSGSYATVLLRRIKLGKEKIRST
jgi:tRNA pseudouridine13 synthase